MSSKKPAARAKRTTASGQTVLKKELNELRDLVAAVGRSQAMIEFEMDGTIISANENFLSTVGYRLDEIVGQHHSMFVETDYSAGAEYRAFWERLNNGEFVAGEFTRIGKAGNEIILQASYNPVLDATGKPSRVVKLAIDITNRQQSPANLRIKTALDRCQTNVMVADTNYDIVYMNDTMLDMMRENEAALKVELPNLEADNLIGTNIDTFHKNPTLQRGILSGLTGTVETSLEINGLNFDLIVSPIIDTEGERIGTVVEWEDVTEKLARQEVAQRSASENSRIKTALDNCQTNVMVADTNYDIVYMNDTMLEMMRGNEDNLRADLPSLDTAALLGTNIDTFHKNPAHQRRILDTLTSTTETSLNIGGLDFDLVVSPIVDDEGTRIGTVVEWADVTAQLAKQQEDQRLADDNFRIRLALDKCTTNVMVADPDLNIIYMNETMTGMMRDAEGALRKDIPNLNANELIGTCIDQFHKSPSHQRDLLEKLSTTYEADVIAGGMNFHLVVNPVHNADRVRIGTVVEWRDETMEKQVEEEIENLVTKAVAGDLSVRIPLEGKEGFMRNLAESLNTQSGIVEDVMTNLGSMLATLADGDLTNRIDADYQGLFDEIKQNANNTAERLSSIIAELQVGANEVSSASEEISTGTNDLSSRTEQQASSLQQTAASMEEMAGTVKQNAENAQQANQLSIAARDVAVNGGGVVEEAVSAMSNIEDSSRKISDIIGVIDEIAFQTNLLALNASVEAARAGDAGRGFAVVASEVRTLAQRSTQAAKDIKELIVDSSGQVKSGVTLVNAAGESLSEIVDSIKKVTDIVSEIAAASEEQSTGVAEINRAITSMDEATQQNSALVEENAAAAKTLRDQSETMHSRMGFFKLGDDSATFKSIEPVAPSAVRGQPRVRQMQSAVATAIKEDADWSEF
jgi:methyl-accepting chemotaxis protein